MWRKVHAHGLAVFPLSFTAESGGARQSWAAALQEAVTETLSEVVEKIWSNRANRHCADCGASRPDWAAVNLGVVICKQCAGEDRGLKPK
jgi:Arf-GAP/Rho-GAP domain/ANK repeat/PH domain-containing protein 3